jgi:Asp-tRNA(Asn)/Glu-tRNA(Gln) amidotransferase A subunit family amidase
VPQMPPYNLDTYCHCGPMARTVADCLLFENAMAGPHEGDVVSLRPKYELPERLEDVKGMRIAVSTNLGDWPVDEEVARNTLEMAGSLREQGAIVEEVELQLPQAEIMRAAAIHFHIGFAVDVAKHNLEHPDLVTEYAKDFPRWAAENAQNGTLTEKLEIEGRLYLRLSKVFDSYDALICPTCGTRGFKAGDDYVGYGPEVGGRTVDHYLEALLTPVFNVFSRCPVLSVPSGFANNGVPTGIQIVGRTYDDVTPFRVGAACEQARPWLDSREHRPEILI